MRVKCTELFELFGSTIIESNESCTSECTHGVLYTDNCAKCAVVYNENN